MSLSIKKVERLKAPGRYRDQRNLFLQITREGYRSWLLRYELAGVKREMGLGPVADVTLEEAREKARVARGQLREGIDPLTAKREARAANLAAQKKTMTFSAAADAWFEAHSSRWKNDRFRKQVIKSITDYAGETLGPLAVDKIDTAHVLAVLEQPVPVWRGHPAGKFWVARAKSARSLRERIEAVLDYASVRGWRSGVNPARWSSHLDALLVDKLPAAKSHAALPYPQVPLLMAELRERYTVQRRALEFTILCATRTDETLGATWDEIDFAARTWTIPPERMKATRPHVVPLSERAVAILKAQPIIKDNPHVFAGSGRTGKLSARSLASLLADMRDNCTVHGMRSSFRDWAGETTATPPDVIEHCLAHRVGSNVERAYARSTLLAKRRVLMDAWAAHCNKPQIFADVVLLKKKTK